MGEASVGAWPQPGIVTSLGRGPPPDHLGCHIGGQDVGTLAAQQQGSGCQPIVGVPDVEIALVVAELGDDGGVVVDGDPARIGAPRRGIRHAAPELIRVQAEGRVAVAQPGLQFRHRVADRRLADIGRDAAYAGLRNVGADVVDDEMGDAVLQDARRQGDADQPAH